MDQSPGQAPPLNLDRAIQLTFSLYRFGFARFFLIGLIFYLPIAVIGNLVQVQLSDELIRASRAQLDFVAGRDVELADLFPMSSMLVSLALSLTFGVVGYLYNGGLIELTRRILAAESAGAVESIGTTLRRLPTLLGAGLLVMLATMGLAIAGMTVGMTLILANVANGALRPGPLVFGGLLVCVATVALLIFVSVRLALVVQAVMLERRPILSSMGRSWRLVAGSGLRVLGYTVVFGLLVGVVGLIGTAAIELTIGSGIDIVDESITFDPVIYVVSGLLSALITIALAPIPLIALTLLFLDIRYRREGVPPERLPVASVPEEQI
jgi:hypothetical protein